MSQKKGDPSVKKESAGKKSRPAGLPEITHECIKEWDDISADLKEYFRENYQDLQSILPDPVCITLIPGYKQYLRPHIEEAEVQAILPENDPGGINKLLFMGHWSGQNAVYLKAVQQQQYDKISAYRVIRSMCSPQLNHMLSTDEAFLEGGATEDPLQLLTIIKRLISARTDGNEELDQMKAHGDWLTMRMLDGEATIIYGRRAVKMFEKLSQTGMTEAELPTPRRQSMRFIDGLDSGVPAHHAYKLYLINSKQQLNTDIYPATLVDAINRVTKHELSYKNNVIKSPTPTPHSAFRAEKTVEDEEKKGGKTPKGKAYKGKNSTHTEPNKVDGDKEKKKVRFSEKTVKFEGTCFNCGKVGHKANVCRSPAKNPTASPHTAYAALKIPAEEEYCSYYTTFGTMHDEDEQDDNDYDRRCNMVTCTVPGPETGLPATGESTQSVSTEAIFDTGATGTIITCGKVLTDIKSCSPTVFKGLHGSLTVTKAGQLGDIGVVHFDPRAGLSIISASDILLQGHHWEFHRGDSIDTDAFLVHTAKHTYSFKQRGGLYVCDLGVPPEGRHPDAIQPRQRSAHPAVVLTPEVTILYASRLPTTAANEKDYSNREVKRSIAARRLQASLGFPPDTKFISALRAGAFLNCDILPEDVLRATAIWGANVAALKGRTTRERPLPPPQQPMSRRSFDEQHMHCDVMFINRQPFLVSITHPLAIVLVACVENLTAPTLRQSVRKMFGTIGSRRISIVRFTSDNERGIAALVGDMNAMGVEVITVGPGQHDHIIERMIRHLKETIRSTIFSLPYLVADALMPHLVLSCAKKLLLFPSSTRSDRVSPFEAFFGRKADTKMDIGPPFGTYCQVTNRTMSNAMDPRTIGCLYLEPKMNGTGTHTFLRLDTRSVIQANHFTVLPIPPIVITTVNGWASKNKIHTSVDPIFTFHDRDITLELDDDTIGGGHQLERVPETKISDPVHIQPFFGHPIDEPAASVESPPDIQPEEIRGDIEQIPITTDHQATSDEVLEPTESVEEIPEDISEADTPVQANVRTYTPPRLVEPREKSTRIRKPVNRLNLVATEVPEEVVETPNHDFWSMMTVSRALRLFPEKTTSAIESEVKSLLEKETFSGVHITALSQTQRQKILRSNMNVVEKYLPYLDSDGNRKIDKVKARFCVDGRAQVRDDYRPEDIESPTASMAAIFATAQIAAAEQRFIMVGDVGSAYLNAKMPTDIPDKILHMFIAKDVTDEIIRQDSKFAPYRRPDGGLLVRLNKALYGCIESAKLWYKEIAGTLENNGFTANPRDVCVFNKDVAGKQFTILVYVDDLKMTCENKSAVLEMEQILLKTYGQFRTTHDKILQYLGMTWDYTEPGFVKVSQTGMIQDIITAREKIHDARGTKLVGNPNTPGAPYLFERTLDCALLSTKDADIFHRDVATLLFLSTHARQDITLVVGELCKRVKTPTTEDDKKLDRLICYLRGTRDVPLRLGCTLPPKVTVSIDAAFANRDLMKSTSGMCVTLGVGFFISSSKVQKLNSKSSTEAEIIAVSDGMNIPLWLADFLQHQGYGRQAVRLEQDNQSCMTLLTKGRSTAETTRFIEIRKFWISDYIRIGAVNIVYVPTEDMTSDYFTKPLQGAVFTKMVKKVLGK